MTIALFAEKGSVTREITATDGGLEKELILEYIY